MINELSSLSKALEQAGIVPLQSYRNYIPLPNVSAKAPCIRIWVKGGQVVDFEAIDRALAMQLRKFGSNQASFPGLNLISLYRVTDESEKKLVAQCIEKPESIDVLRLRTLCRENAWEPHQSSRIKNCFSKTPKKMIELLDCAGIPKENLLNTLAAECASFANAQVLHESLTRAVFEKLEKKQDVGLALLILFQLGDASKPCKDDKRNISVFFDTDAYDTYGMYAASREFTAYLNTAFLQAERILMSGASEQADAFGEIYIPPKAPMPRVKLAAGFKSALYTMYDKQPCQSRYHNFDDKRDSYPLSAQHRVQFQAALNWLGGDAKSKGITWLNTGKGEAVFAYPSSLPDVTLPFVQFFGRIDQSGTFRDISRSLLTTFNGISPKDKPESVQVFVLKKIDNGRTKILYSQSASADALMHAAENWEMACNDLPGFAAMKPSTPFPVNVAAIVNQVWRQNGESSTVSAMHPYEGIELFLHQAQHRLLLHELHILVQHGMPLFIHAGPLLHSGRKCNRVAQLEQILPVLSMLLFFSGNRKDDYMEATPYLMGQLLKASDELHALYCKVVRNNQIPPQLVGSALFVAASETPGRTLSQLSVRMAPYLSWAKQYRTKNEDSSGLAGWYLRIFEQIANKLATEYSVPMRWSDAQKAQLFIGYLASFPKQEKQDESNAESSEQRRVEQDECGFQSCNRAFDSRGCQFQSEWGS